MYVHERVLLVFFLLYCARCRYIDKPNCWALHWTLQDTPNRFFNTSVTNEQWRCRSTMPLDPRETCRKVTRCLRGPHSGWPRVVRGTGPSWRTYTISCVSSLLATKQQLRVGGGCDGDGGGGIRTRTRPKKRFKRRWTPQCRPGDRTPPLPNTYTWH